MCIGKTEGFEDQLRSILAQFHFAYEIHRFEAQGVPFRTYLYVPEQHPQTKNIFYEREDEAHLIKVNNQLKNNIVIIVFNLENSKSHQEWRTIKFEP